MSDRIYLNGHSMLQAGDSALLAANAAEASNPSLFVSGWRPSVGSASSGCWSRPSATH
jgi:hypothetical protein